MFAADAGFRSTLKEVIVPAVMLSWPVVIATAVLMVAGTYLYASRRVSRTNANLRSVATQIAQRGVVCDPTSFTVCDRRHVVVVTAAEVLVVDLARAQLVQHLRHTDIHGLRVEEGGQHVAFSFLLNGGAESRRILSRSIVEFGRLFQLIARQGKDLQFVPEKVA